MLADLLRKAQVTGGFLVPVYHVYFAKHFVQFRIVDGVVFFAKAGEHEIHPRLEHAAEIVNPHGATMRKRIRQVGGNHQRRSTLRWRAVAADSEGDVSARQIGLHWPERQ